jgi:spore maturation protein B
MDNIRQWCEIGSMFVVPFVMAAFIVYGLIRRVRVYEEFVEGAKEGFNTGVKIMPYLVAILFAIGMFRASGGLDILTRLMGPVLGWIGFPPELVPMAIVRPLTGAGSTGILADLVKRFGSDAPVVRMAATLYGSTETTFYVLAVYFGSVNIRNTRHALPAGLLADVFGTIFSVIVINKMFHG